MESIYLTALRIMCVLIVSRCGNCIRKHEFDMRLYTGLRELAIIALYKKVDHSKLLCYGVIVDSRKAVVPCECVSRGQNPDDIATAWFQPDPPKKVVKLNARDFEVGLMTGEHGNDNPYKRVAVQEIILSSRCDGSYVVNYASLLLAKRISGSRLVWVNSASEPVLKTQIAEGAIGTATFGKCSILKWTNEAKMKVSFVGKQSKFVTELSKPDVWVIRSYKVKFNHWLLCVNNVCPDFQPKGVSKVDRKKKYCHNEVEASRYCVTWDYEKAKLCDVMPGTPVFCDMDNHIEGVVGLLYTKTTWCNETQNGIMSAFNDALDLVKDDLRIQYAPGYKEMIAKWELAFKRVKLSSSSRLAVNSIFIVALAFVVLRF